MLTDQQIQQLFQFCEKHYVRYYDVQIELVDHLASKIEKLQKQEPGLPFEAALEKVYKEFGVMGFSTVLREKEKHLSKQERQAFFRVILNEFAWPNILGVSIFAVFTYYLMTALGSYWFLAYYTPSTILFVILIKRLFSLSKLEKRSGKKFIYMQSVFYPSFSAFLLMQSNVYQLTNIYSSLKNHQVLIFTLIVTLFSVLLKAALVRLNQNKEHLLNTHPEVFQAE